MEHHAFGSIDWDAQLERWTGRAPLDFFSDYDTRGASDSGGGADSASPLAIDRGEDADEVELCLIGAGKGKPSARQERAFLDFRKDPTTVCHRVVRAIFEHYQAHWREWRTNVEPGHDDLANDASALPTLRSPDGLKDLVRLEMLSVLDGAPAVLGFCFSCTWNAEHGLGVLVRDGKVVEIGEDKITCRDSASANGSEVPPLAPE